jgi:hypothetical protein
MRRYMAALVCLVSVGLLGSCVFETTPETPGNAAIRLPAALRAQDRQDVMSLVCGAITDANDVDFADHSSFGELADFYEAVLRNWSEERAAFGGESQYSVEEEVDLEVDEAWTEIEFRGEETTEVWRLHMVREDGSWRACSAEQRQ